MSYNRSDFKILIIEDHKILKKMLEKSYAVLSLRNKKCVLQAAIDCKPHLILFNIAFPDPDYFDMFLQLKASYETSAIPIMVLTEFCSLTDEEKWLCLGAADYIKSPFNEAIIDARIKTQMQLIKHIQNLESLGYTETLTKLPNRRSFDSHLSYEWERAIREKSGISLLMLDVDNFKEYNDKYGHMQGDCMLKAVASSIKASLKRSVDIPCRFGGEEFAILLPGTDNNGAYEIAERIRRSIADLNVAYKKEIPTACTVSIGLITAYPQIGDSSAEFIEESDRLLYEAKNCGRNLVKF